LKWDVHTSWTPVKPCLSWSCATKHTVDTPNTVIPQVQPENSVLQWGDLNLLLLSVTVYFRQDGTWVVKTDSWTMWMSCDIFVTDWLWRGCLLTTGHLSKWNLNFVSVRTIKEGSSPSHPVVVDTWDMLWVLLQRDCWKSGCAPDETLSSESWFSTV